MRKLLQTGLLAAGIFAAGWSFAQAPAAGKSRAVELFKNRQYNDAIKVLRAEVEGKPESECGAQWLLFGECHYLTGQYDPARPFFVKAVQFLGEGREKMFAESRLASTLYRLGDFAAATEKIDAFLAKYPNEPSAGKLLVYKMLVLARGGKDSERELTAIHQRIQQNVQKFDYSTAMEADQALCEFYRKTDQPDKAQALYARIVNNFRQVAQEHEKERRPVPDAAKKSHDNAALQLGLLAMERKTAGEAIKWFENIRFDAELKQKARLYMAKLAYERQDFGNAIGYLTGEGYLDTVPEGPVKWDMWLIVGLAQSRSGNIEQTEAMLRRVPAQARGFAQAQLTLANLYRDRQLRDYALKAYQNAAGSSDYAPAALLNIGNIQIAQSLFRQAGETFSQLFEKFPLSVEAKQAKEKLDLLASKGVVVTVETGESSLAAWEKVAREKAGTVEAAQALMSLARYHSKKITDEKTGKVLRAPNHAATAAACDKLLDEKVYTGRGWSETNWKAFRCDVLFTRAQCELAGLAAGSPNAARAAAWLKDAAQLADAKNLELVRSIEITLVEALFKSDRKEDKELAEKRYGELENNYGNDPRLQRLSLELADWYAEQKRFADAGRMLAGVASRGKELPAEDLLKILYNAGAMYSRAGSEAAQKPGETGFWIRISPKAAVALGDEDLLKSYPPLQKTINMRWPNDGKKLPASEALGALSQAAKVPFTWAQTTAEGSVAAYLKRKRLSFRDGPTTPAEVLGQILERPYHRLEFSIGLTDGTPTLPPPKDKDDPAAETWKVIEIYDSRRPELYYQPAGASFGAFRELYGDKPVLLYRMLQRMEAATKMRVVWAEGLDKQEKLATEFREFPNLSRDRSATCYQVLQSVLDAVGLQWRIVPRDVAVEYFEAAKEQFNKLRQIDPKSKYGERALLNLAMNFYSIKDYARMKAVLREYLKVFDNPENEHRQMAAYWIGWVFEKENNFREAGNYYARATEERLIIAKVPPGAKPATREELKQQLSYESQAALLEPSAGEFAEKPLAALLEFVTINSHLEVRADASAQTVGAPVKRAAFKNVPIFDVLCDGLEQLGLTFHVENVNREYAEKAYFRMIVANRKDNAMPQALEAAQTLFRRFPQTTRRREVYGLLIDIYKGLKEYRQVLETMEQLKAITTDPAEKQKLAAEIAWIYFDVADYPRAMKAFDACLTDAKDPQDRIDLRDGFARAAYRARKPGESLAAYETLLKEDGRPLRQFIHNLMAYVIKIETGQADERDLPRDAEKLIVGYEQLTEALRAKLAPEDTAKATWVYFALAKRDLKKGYADQAITKLSACANSPDDSLAAEALFELGAIHMAQKKYAEARDALEELLFRGKGTDALVRGTYALGACYQELGRPEKAKEKFQQLLDRYPLSPLVEEVKKNPLFAGNAKASKP